MKKSSLPDSFRFHFRAEQQFPVFLVGIAIILGLLSKPFSNAASIYRVEQLCQHYI